MLKISEGGREGRGVTLRLEGSLVGPWVAELRQSCEPLLSHGSALALELEQVSFVDEPGADLLIALQRHGVTLLNATPFVAEQLQSRANVTPAPDSHRTARARRAPAKTD